MDQRRFDDLTRLVGTGASRRRILRGLVGVVGAIPLAARWTWTFAQDACDPVCADGQDCCAAVCADLTADPANCGTCGFACAKPRVCVSGSCCSAFLSACSSDQDCCAGLACCGGFCAELGVESACSACDDVCGPCQVCSEFVCTDGCDDVCFTCNEQEGTCDVPLIECGACERCNQSEGGCYQEFCGGDCPDCSAPCTLCTAEGTCRPCSQFSQACVDGQCVDPGALNATITVHTVTCPTGTDDLFASCHDNTLAGVSFSTGADIMTTGEDGVATTLILNAGPFTLTEDSAIFAAYLGAYVYCAEQNSGTVLYDGIAVDGSVALTAGPGEDIVCDWFNLTATDIDPPTDNDDGQDKDHDVDGGETSGAITLPTTGTGDSDPTDDHHSEVALIAAGVAYLVGKRLRTLSAPDA